MTRLRLSGRNLVRASWGSYMWLSASNTGKESSRDGIAISLRAGFSLGGNDVTTSAQVHVPRLGVGPKTLRCRAVDDGEIHRRGCGDFVVVGVDVDLHHHPPTPRAQHPGHRHRGALPNRP